MTSSIETLWPSANAPLPPISDIELDYLFYMDSLEAQWKENLPNYNFREYMRIFPEAVSAARRGLKTKLKIYKIKLRKVGDYEQEYYDGVIVNLPWQERAEFQEQSKKDFEEVRKGWESKIKAIMFNLSFLDELEGKKQTKKTGGVTEEEIARAKEVSILNFYDGKLRKHGQRAVGLCPFMSEKTPSFTIYLDQNTFHCYSCGANGTVVDFIMRQQNVDFLTAVKTLIK